MFYELNITACRPWSVMLEIGIPDDPRGLSTALPSNTASRIAKMHLPIESVDAN